MKPFLIMKAGGTFPGYAEENGDFEHWIAANMGVGDDAWKSVDVRKGEAMPDPALYSGTVITGSHCMVTEWDDWMRSAAQWIRDAAQVGHPMLGVCFGHQLMGEAFGGKAGYHPKGREIGTARITLTDQASDDPLFGQLPLVFHGHVTHSQTVLALPPDAVHLASGSHDPHMAFRVGDNAWGVQFHPEFDAPAIRHYIRELSDALTEEGLDVQAVETTVAETPHSAALLAAFARYASAL